MFSLDRVVPWGRTFDEYGRMFALTGADLGRRILGCADGPASFNAEATRRGHGVVSCDPLYRFSTAEIRRRVEETATEIIAETRRSKDDFVWNLIPSVEALERLRLGAMEAFLADFDADLASDRYDARRMRAHMIIPKRLLIGLGVAISLFAFRAQTQTLESKVDAVFARWNASTPGCAVGVAKDGVPVLAKGYGSADLEHDVPIMADTIFEAGSVSKQFTAAAVLLLAREGKLSIDDPGRKYLPELPEYPPAPVASASGAGPAPKPQSGGGGLLVRHMLNHTSGLRDWGSVAGIAGWPRTTRAHTHAHVLDIVSRQRALNFPSGTRWSYSNTGYNLAAIIVSRVSGAPFADFTRDRLFRPLGMTDTSWRDDHTRIVKRRAIAYRERDGAFHTDMPFEDVHGNAGLLTTVGDLLKWNENFAEPVVGDARFVQLQQEPGRFNDGRPHGYAFGLFVGTHGGLREVYHSGSTAGYSAFLTRFPDERLSVAVLCNAATNATRFGRDVADLYLAGQLNAPPAPPTHTVSVDEMSRVAGMYRNTTTGAAVTIARGRENGLQIENGAALMPIAPLRFVTARTTDVVPVPGDRYEFDGKGRAKIVDEYGTVTTLERVETAEPSAADLHAYEGRYASDEAETELVAKMNGGRLVIWQRPDRTIAATPLYADAFRVGSLGTIVFTREASGRVVALRVVQDRVWGLVFQRKS